MEAFITHSKKVKYCFFILLCVIIFFMAQFTWGDMPKSQTEAQLITEYVAQEIATHEADPQAHMGADESIDIHRKNTILDHPTQSIVSDKFSSADRFIVYPLSLDYDSYYENYTYLYLGSLNSIWENSPLTGDSLVQWVNYQISDMGWTNGDIVIDFQLSISGTSGTRQGEFNVLFAKIQVKNSYYRLGYFDTSWKYGSWITFTSHIADRWRIYYSSVDGVIYYFLNGTQIGYFTATPDFDSSDYMFNVLLNRGTSLQASLYFGGVQLGISS